MNAQGLILEELNRGRALVLESKADEVRKEFIEKDSYVNSKEYKREVERMHKFQRLGHILYSRQSANRKELDKISRPKPREQWTDEDQYDSLLGGKPEVYDDPELGERLKAQNKKLARQASVADHQASESQEKIEQMKKDARDIEKRMHKLGPLKRASKDDYEGFDTTSTGVASLDAKIQSGECFIAEMPPKEYILRCAFEVFDNATIESTIGAIDFNKAKKYAKKMRSGEKFHLPYLNARAGGQEGRHRAIAAMINGYRKIPVLIL